jgi:hypothetical protein
MHVSLFAYGEPGIGQSISMPTLISIGENET